MAFTDLLVDPLLNRCTPLTEVTGQGAFQAIEELAQKAGMETPKLYRLPPMAGPTLDNFPAGAIQHSSDPVIILGHDINHRLYGVDYANPATINDEFRAILAHELGHLKRQDAKFPMGTLWRSNLSPFVYTIGALAGTYAVRAYLEHRKDKTQLPPPDEIAHALNKQLEVPKEHKGTTLETIGKVALYTAMGTLGFAGGMLRLRSIRHHMEYACDAFSKELMGSGEPLAGALSKANDHFKKIYAENLAHLPQEKRAEAVKVLEIMESFLHPPVPKRIEALQR